MRFFLGGVPFGCNNIGDEAILAGVVKIYDCGFQFEFLGTENALGATILILFKSFINIY